MPVSAPSEFDVFVSYSREDADFARLLAASLRDRGLLVWIDNARLEAGRNWFEQIEADMNCSGSCLVLWGKCALAREIRRTKGKDFRVIYVILPVVNPPRGTFASVDTWVAFQSHLDEPGVIGSLVAGIKGEAPPDAFRVELPNQPAPYRGLAAFGPDDGRFLYGRAADIARAQEITERERFVAILGNSGCGKTSVLQAGLIPASRESAKTRSQIWLSLILQPGASPLRSLCDGLARLPTTSDLGIDGELHQRFMSNPREFASLVRRILPAGVTCVLALDRLEEIFTLCEAHDEAEAFVEAIAAVAGATDLPPVCRSHHARRILRTDR